MAIPASPVIPGRHDLPQVEFAKNQPQYLLLPAHYSRTYGVVTARWKLTWRERLRTFFTGDVWVQIMTYGSALQPSKVTAIPPVLDEEPVDPDELPYGA